MPAMFIRVDIDDAVQGDADLCKQLVEVCPVDIFALEDSGRVATVDDNLDECTLCDLCTRLVEVCPVDIFAPPEGGGVATVEANLDECTLCELCLDAAGDKVRVVKLYEG